MKERNFQKAVGRLRIAHEETEVSYDPVELRAQLLDRIRPLAYVPPKLSADLPDRLRTGMLASGRRGQSVLSILQTAHQARGESSDLEGEARDVLLRRIRSAGQVLDPHPIWEQATWAAAVTFPLALFCFCCALQLQYLPEYPIEKVFEIRSEL